MNPVTEWMTKQLMTALVVALLLTIVPARHAGAAEISDSDAEETAREVSAKAGWSDSAHSSQDWVQLVERHVLTGDIVHYQFRVRVGQGKHDVIGIHRVVRETTPHNPIRTFDNLFLLHGDFKDFTGSWLPGGSTRPDFGLAVYLAQRNVDVWGIDQAWTLVPASETNFDFMKDWGIQRQAEDLSAGIEVARRLRAITGNGYEPMLLMAWSSGAPTGFALLNQETRLPAAKRKIRAFIPVDQGVITNDPAWNDLMCAVVASYQATIDGGQYQDFNPLPPFGVPALQAPNAPSQLINGFTNLQAALALGTLPIYDGFNTHLWAGIFDENGVPTGLQYTKEKLVIDFMVNAPPYEPLAFERDEYITSCSQYNVSWDDRLRQIRVPILWVQAGNAGFGYGGVHTLDVLGTNDLTRLSISLHPPDEALLDFAHVDLFTAENAPDLVWRPMLNWVRQHSDH